jgi:hypothetical protein
LPLVELGGPETDDEFDAGYEFTELIEKEFTPVFITIGPDENAPENKIEQYQFSFTHEGAIYHGYFLKHTYLIDNSHHLIISDPVTLPSYPDGDISEEQQK